MHNRALLTCPSSAPNATLCQCASSGSACPNARARPRLYIRTLERTHGPRQVSGVHGEITSTWIIGLMQRRWKALPRQRRAPRTSRCDRPCACVHVLRVYACLCAPLPVYPARVVVFVPAHAQRWRTRTREPTMAMAVVRHLHPPPHHHLLARLSIITTSTGVILKS